MERKVNLEEQEKRVFLDLVDPVARQDQVDPRDLLVEEDHLGPQDVLDRQGHQLLQVP